MLSTDDLVASEDAFFAATGITDGELLAGVRYRAGVSRNDKGGGKSSPAPRITA